MGRKRLLVLAGVVLGLVTVGAAAVAIQASTSASFDQSLQRFLAARAEAQDVADRGVRVAQVSGDVVRAADVALGVTDPDVLDDPHRASLTSARDAAARAEAAAKRRSVSLPALSQTKPVLPWDLASASATLDQETRALHDTTNHLTVEWKSTAIGNDAVVNAGNAAVAAAIAHAPVVESRNVPAAADAVSDFRKAATNLTYSISFNVDRATNLVGYETAVLHLKQAHLKVSG